MPTLSFYEYWEDFIEEWYNNGNATPNPTPKGWTNPNDPKYNMSSDYLPEPWWGNDGNKTLHSVVINFNPGEGGKEQEKKNLPYINSYANDIVNPCNVLCKTCQWHWNNRAIPIFQALKAIGSIKGNVWLYNHLSIEMIPWHTKTVGIKSYLLYVKDNVQRIFDYVIKFAANESRRIANDTLKNVVILKMSGGMTINILNIFTNAGINNKVIIPPTPPLPNGGRYMVFSFDDIQGVKFVSIWGQRSRNNFPPQDDLKEILKTIQFI